MDFDELFIDGDDEREKMIPTDEIGELIGEYVSIELYSSVEPRVIVTDDFDALSPRKQVLVSMFANELVYRKTERESRFLSVNDIFTRYGINWDDHYPYFRNLEQEELVERRNSKVYALRTEQLPAALAELQ